MIVTCVLVGFNLGFDQPTLLFSSLLKFFFGLLRVLWCPEIPEYSKVVSF